MRQDTLISSIDGNPRYRVQKEGWDSRWDYAPREDLLCSEKGEDFLNYWKAWEIKYSDNGFDYKNIGLVTDFDGDFPTATVRHGEIKKPITGTSLAEVCTKVIEVYEELLKEADEVEKAEPSFLNEEPIFDEDNEIKYKKWLEEKGTEWFQRDDMQEPDW